MCRRLGIRGYGLLAYQIYHNNEVFLKEKLMERSRIGIIKDLLSQMFFLILVGIVIIRLVLVGQSVCAQGIQGESWGNRQR